MFLFQQLKNLAKKIFLSLKGDSVLRRRNRAPRILFWHGVDEILDQKVEAESFDVISFKKQIAYLNKYYEIISIDEFYNRYQTKEFTNREIVLTFDDGYLNNLNVVYPILNELNLPFTVFVSTEHIETDELFPTSIARLIIYGAYLKKINVPCLKIEHADISDIENRNIIYSKVIKTLKSGPIEEVRKIVSELKANLSYQDYITLVEKYKSVKPMNWEEVKKLHSSGVTIGSHCKYHICCHSNQQEEEVKAQIIESKNIIEDKLEAECKYFAYPNGNYTTASNNFVEIAGYTMGFSTEKNIKIENVNGTSAIPRIGVPLNINTFKIYINLYPKK